ncbi:MAG: RnfABCDGE type electron transport complex subunit D [Aquitalea sp.]|nr:RnfABCDGE type electron transport complex subunit D [Aquitalea sp.]
MTLTPLMRLGPDLTSRNRQQLLALLPALLVLLWQQGIAALLTLLLSSLCALLADALGQGLRAQPILPCLRQGEALLSAVLLTLLLPQAGLVLGGSVAVAILLLRQLFGGNGQSLFHPVAGALLLAALYLSPSPAPANPGLCLATVAGALWLSWRGIIRWQAPLSLLLVVLISLPIGSGWLLGQPALWLLAGWVMTDGCSTPVTPQGRMIYGQTTGMILVSVAALGQPSSAGLLLASILLLLSAAVPLLDALTLQAKRRM